MPADVEAAVKLPAIKKPQGIYYVPVFCKVPRTETSSGTADRIQLITAPVLINKRTDFYFHL
jgi:hypothetical protein